MILLKNFTLTKNHNIQHDSLNNAFRKKDISVMMIQNPKMVFHVVQGMYGVHTEENLQYDNMGCNIFFNGRVFYVKNSMGTGQGASPHLS